MGDGRAAVALNWLRNERVLVTGHTGFKGAWLTSLLSHLLVPFAGLSDTFITPSLYSYMGPMGAHQEFWGDVADPAVVQAALQEFSPTIVVHLAAESLIFRALSDPRRTWRTNVLGTATILEAVSDVSSPPTAVLVVTSDKCYDLSTTTTPRRETDPLGGDDPYSASKAATELLVHSWPSTGSTAVATVRGGNVIGGGDTAAYRLVPDFYRALASGETLSVRNASGIRPWQDVRDCLYAYLSVTEKLMAGDWPYHSINVGPPGTHEVTVGTLIDMLKSLHPEVNVATAPGNDVEHGRLLLNTDALRAAVTLPEPVPLDLMIADADAVYASMYAGGDVRAVVQKQWMDYLA